MLLPHALRAIQKGTGEPLTLVGIAKFGSTTASQTPTLSLTSLTGGIASSPSAGDLVIAAVCFTNGTNRNITCTTSGYTEIADLYANDTNDSQLAVYRKVLTSAETSVSFDLGVTVVHCMAAQVWRGGGAPINVTSVTTATVVNTGQPNPPENTSVAPNSAYVVFGSGAGSVGIGQSLFSAPAGLDNFQTAITGVVAVIGTGATLRPDANDTYDVGAFGGGSTDLDNSACAVSLRVDSSVSLGTEIVKPSTVATFPSVSAFSTTTLLLPAGGQVSVNGGAAQSGNVTVTAGDSLVFSATAQASRDTTSVLSVSTTAGSVYYGVISTQTFFAYTTTGTFSFIVPKNETSISVLCVGGGGGARRSNGTGGAGGGALAYKNNISVTPGSSITLTVGAGGTSTLTPTNGTNSTFNTTVVVAVAGSATSTDLGGAGGSSASCVGDFARSGNTGGNTSGAGSGGGGSAPLISGTQSNGAAGADNDVGAGGLGISFTNGTASSSSTGNNVGAVSGGGGGGYGPDSDENDYPSADGGRGAVIIVTDGRTFSSASNSF